MKTIIIIIAILFSVSANAGDTTKVKLDTSYVLNGSFDDFNLLYVAVTRPRDVTPNQVAALEAWIRKLQIVVKKRE